MFANLVFINLGRYTIEALLATTLESDWLWLPLFCTTKTLFCTTKTSIFLVTHYFYGGIFVCAYQ